MDRGFFRAAVIPLGLMVAVFVIYGQTLGHGFSLIDDQPLLVENPHLNRGLSWEGARWAFSNNLSGGPRSADYWAPVAHLSHMLDFQLFGVRAPGHHFTNILIHALNSALVFRLFRRMTGAESASALLAALFAVHPFQAETVAWLIQRKGLLSVFFGLSSMEAYVLYARSRSRAAYGAALLFFALSLMSKMTFMTLPFTLLLLDCWPLNRMRNAEGGTRRLFVEKLPFFALTLLGCVVAFSSVDNSGIMQNLERIPLNQRLANAAVSYAAYLGKTIFPIHLCIIYPHPGDSLPAWKIAGSGLLLAGITLAAVGLARGRAYLLIGWLWFLGNLAPMIGVVKTEALAMADRFVYLPIIGLFIMLVWRVSDWIPRRRAAGIAIAAAVLLTLSARSWVQAGFWRDHDTLFGHALETPSGFSWGWSGDPGVLFGHVRKVASNNWSAHYNFAVILERQGKFDEAKAHYLRVLQINPPQAPGHVMKARNNLGGIFAREGRLDEAREHFAKALAINPHFDLANNNMGSILVRMGRPEEAVPYYLEALKANPDYFSAHYNLAGVYARQGERWLAMEHYRAALKLRPDYGPARRELERLE